LNVLISNQNGRIIQAEYLETHDLYMYLRKTFGDQQPMCFIHREVEYPDVGFVQSVAEIVSAYKSSLPSVRRCEMIAESEFQRRVREITAFLQDQAWIAPEENLENTDDGRDRTKQMLVRSFLNRGNITMVHGPAKVGKTTLALGASAMVIFGKQGNVLMKGSAITTPRDSKPGKVVYLMFDPNCANNTTKLKRDVTGTYGLGEPEVDNSNHLVYDERPPYIFPHDQGHASRPVRKHVAPKASGIWHTHILRGLSCQGKKRLTKKDAAELKKQLFHFRVFILVGTTYHIYVNDCTMQDVEIKDAGDVIVCAQNGSILNNLTAESIIVLYDNSVLTDSVVSAVDFRNGKIGNVTAGGIYCGHDYGYGAQRLELIGDVYVTGSIGGAIDANGHTITLDMTKWKTTDEAIVGELSRIYNANLKVVALSKVGSYRLASNARGFGHGDTTSFYNWDTNQWEYHGGTIGDLDGIIELYDENGIHIADCTVNGDAEYFGRYNYTLRIDDDGTMYLDVGWNNREGHTYAADGYDNDTMDKAKTIPVVLPASGTKLTIDSADDVDWFKFNLATTGRKSSYIGIDFKQWAGDLDLYLYDANGTQLDYAKSVTDNERISLKGLAAGDYYVKVEGYEGNINEYKLVYSLPEPIVLTDDYEKGDNKAHSYHLGKLSKQITLDAAISRSDDQDYYMFQLPKKGLSCDTITLTYDDEIGDLDLYLYGSNGMTLLATSQNTSGGTEQISLAGMKHGVYYVAVKAKNGGLGNYQLSFDVNTHEVNPDKYEGNNTLKKATKLYTLNGKETLSGLSIHDEDVDYYKFSIMEKGSADDYITLSCEVSLGDLDLEILNSNGEVVAYSRTAENDDTVSLNGFEIGEYYIRVSGYNNVANNYSLSWNVTNSSLIPSDSYEGMEPIAIRENQTINGLSIAKPVKDDETRADTFKITLEYDAWKRSKIILTDYRSDWEDGVAYVIKDADGNVKKSGTGSEISLYGLKKGEYYLTVDTPNEDEYSEYSLIAQCLPDSDNAKDNTWSVFIYMAGDNNLEGAFLNELLYMQQAILPESVEVYVLLDRREGLR